MPALTFRFEGSKYSKTEFFSLSSSRNGDGSLGTEKHFANASACLLKSPSIFLYPVSKEWKSWIRFVFSTSMLQLCKAALHFSWNSEKENPSVFSATISRSANSSRDSVFFKRIAACSGQRRSSFKPYSRKSSAAFLNLWETCFSPSGSGKE